MLLYRGQLCSEKLLCLKEPAQFRTIPTLRLEAMRGSSLKTSNLAT